MSKSMQEEIQRTLFFLQLIQRTAQANGQDEIAKKAEAAMQQGLSKLNM